VLQWLWCFAILACKTFPEMSLGGDGSQWSKHKSWSSLLLHVDGLALPVADPGHDLLPLLAGSWGLMCSHHI